MSLSGAAKIAGIFGWPVSHSLSPLLHGHWIAEFGLDAAYVPFPCKPDDFPAAIAGLKAAGVRGVNVTVPHKEAAFALASRKDEAATIAGAANLLVFEADGIAAYNTDQYGLTAALDEGLGEGALQGRSAMVLGAGGAARAAVCALSKMGASHVAVLARNPSRAAVLAEALGEKLATTLSADSLDAWERCGRDIALVVNATSAGMKGLPPLDLDLTVLPKDAAVFDAVYNPLRTDLLKRAEVCGLRSIDGLGMLLHQAVPSFAAFFGIEPQVTPALRRKLESALDV